MEYTKEIKKAMNYIENNLKKEIRTEDIADSAGFSKYHFQRVFKREGWQKLHLFFVTPTYVFLILPCTCVLNLRRHLQEHSRRFMVCRRGSIEKC